MNGGDYLQHIKYSFISPEPIDIETGKKMMRYFVKTIDMTQTFLKVSRLPPGYDIIVGLKESHIAFSYWGETRLCILDIFSCKRFSNWLITSHLKKFFNVKRLKTRVILDCEVSKEVKMLHG